MTTVRLRGELDLATVPQAEGAIWDLYARGRTALALDLGGLTFMDAAGLRLLIAARAHAHAHAIGSRLEVVLGNGCARRLAELTETVEHIEGHQGCFAAPKTERGLPSWRSAAPCWQDPVRNFGVGSRSTG